VFENGKRVRKQ